MLIIINREHFKMDSKQYILFLIIIQFSINYFYYNLNLMIDPKLI